MSEPISQPANPAASQQTANQPATQPSAGQPSSKLSIAAQPGTTWGNATFVVGGLGAVKGIRCAGVSAGFRRNPARKDLALVVAEKPAVAAGVFTQNTFCAAPVTVSRSHLAKGEGIKAIILNSGVANAATGEPGIQTAIASAQIVAKHLNCEPHQVLMASTGVIGVLLPEEPFVAGVPLAIANLGAADGTDLAAGSAAAQAIMTTDTHPKQAAVTFTATQSDGVEVRYTIGGMVKGSGMIQPSMATLLGVLATDALLTQEAAQLALKQAMDYTLNKVTVDSDSSTNDSVYLLSTGATSGKTIDPNCPLFKPFVFALTALATDLARQIAYDGEGATKLVTINITGAASDADADAAGRSIANSPLVKTALAGHDANWGRIAMAIGKSGAQFRQEHVDISLMGVPVCRAGLGVAFDENEALRLFVENPEIVIDVDLGAGSAATRFWTCDLTHDYITINGDYRS